MVAPMRQETEHSDVDIGGKGDSIQQCVKGADEMINAMHRHCGRKRLEQQRPGLCQQWYPLRIRLTDQPQNRLEFFEKIKQSTKAGSDRISEDELALIYNLNELTRQTRSTQVRTRANVARSSTTCLRILIRSAV